MDEYTYGTAASFGAGLGGTYNEYRSLSRGATGAQQDEELQIWSWGSSYAVQYRDVTSGSGEAAHQAWTFGGTKTPAANMPVTGSGTYTGKFGATAKTSNWVDSSDANQKISHNNSWSVIGDSALQADFVTGDFTGTLTPTQWKAWAAMNGAAGFMTVNASAVLDPNYAYFMSSDVVLKGTFVDPTSTVTTPKNLNAITGTAVYDTADGWVTNNTTNPMYAGFFGDPAIDSVTGVFAFEATLPVPVGGLYPINDDRRGYISMSGVFNGQ